MTNPTHGRHRKPSSNVLARRAAVGVGAVAVVLLAPSAAMASTASGPAAAPPFPCTGSPFDGFTTCGESGYYGNGVTGGNAGDFAGGDTPTGGG